MKWLDSLAFRFWLAINSLVLAGILSISGIYFSRESTTLENSLKNQGMTAANTLNSAIGLYMLQGDYSYITPLAYSLLSQPNMIYVIIKDNSGKTIVQKGDTLSTNENIFVEKVALEYFQEKVGQVEIGIDTTALDQQRHALFSDTLFTALIISFLSLFLSYLLSRGMTAPIRRLIAATKKMTEGERNVEVVEEGTYDVKELSASFNEMAQTINNHEQILVNEIKRATADLSEKMEVLEALANISSSVLEDEIQRTEILKNTLENMKKYSKTNRISIAFLNRKGSLDIYELYDSGNLEQFELKNYDSSLHEVINNQQTIIHNNIQEHSSSLYEEMQYQKGMRSLLMLPIIANKKTIGTLNISSEIPDRFSTDMILKLSVFTNQIALAIDRIAAYESLQHSAYHDYLTGLPNYRLFFIKINEAIEQAKKAQGTFFAVLYLDLDRFKTINDTLGHTTGDQVLKYVGRQLSACLSVQDTITRIGGDEFSALLTDLKDPEEAVLSAQKMLKKLEEPIIIKEYDIPISASIGIAYYPNDGKDADSLIKNADRAMYRVKERGKKNYAIYTQPIDEQLFNPLSLESDLRKAMEKNEIVVFYQPKINIQNGYISGLEALVRWVKPSKGIILPGQFIPQAEETGLIVPIGEFVLRQAAKQCAAWQSLGLPAIPVSVNLSYRQLLQTNLVNIIDSTLKETGLRPELLELEITESMSMDMEHSLKIFQELKNLGIKISVDDFGTGYSSLSYIRQLPIDRVKIDKSFIKDMTLNPSNQALVSTIINMAHNLNLFVTAEGVETEEQAIHLQLDNCDEIQGFYFSHPLSAEDFEKKYGEILDEAQKWSFNRVS